MSSPCLKPFSSWTQHVCHERVDSNLPDGGLECNLCQLITQLLASTITSNGREDGGKISRRSSLHMRQNRNKIKQAIRYQLKDGNSNSFNVASTSKSSLGQTMRKIFTGNKPSKGKGHEHKIDSIVQDIKVVSSEYLINNTVSNNQLSPDFFHSLSSIPALPPFIAADQRSCQYIWRPMSWVCFDASKHDCISILQQLLYTLVTLSSRFIYFKGLTVSDLFVDESTNRLVIRGMEKLCMNERIYSPWVNKRIAVKTFVLIQMGNMVNNIVNLLPPSCNKSTTGGEDNNNNYIYLHSLIRRPSGTKKNIRFMMEVFASDISSIIQNQYRQIISLSEESKTLSLLNLDELNHHSIFKNE